MDLDDDLQMDQLVKVIAAYDEYKYQKSKATVDKTGWSCTGLTCQCCQEISLVNVEGKYPQAIYI